MTSADKVLEHETDNSVNKCRREMLEWRFKYVCRLSETIGFSHSCSYTYDLFILIATAVQRI